MIKKVIKKMECVERACMSLIFVSMLIVLTMQIVARFIFNSPIIWSEEFSRYVYVWLVYIGLSYCATQDTHVRVTLVLDRLPASVQLCLKGICNFIVVAAVLYMLPHSVRYALKQSALKSGCMQIPMSFVYLAVPVGYVLAFVQLTLQGIQYIMDGLAEGRKVSS
ncbi:MAG: TRAP transporter small permease [Candidatus Ventricola sp.]